MGSGYEEQGRTSPAGETDTSPSMAAHDLFPSPCAIVL